MTSRSLPFNAHVDDLFIGGQWVRANSTARTQIVNPATEEVWGQVPDANQADVDAAVGAARAAFESGVWSQIGAAARAQ
jgi:aldehyde dehydrogenase (NAD+)